MKRNLEVAMVFCGAVIGAGFASGREILTYFSTYAGGGLWGCVLLLVVFTLCTYAILQYCFVKKISTYSRFLSGLFQPKWNRAIAFLVTLFLFCTFFVMAAGSGALLHEQFGWNKNVGILLLVGASFGVLLFDLRGIMQLNLSLTPILIAGIVLISLHAVVDATAPAFSSLAKKAVLNPFSSSLIYVSYNMLLATAVLVPLSRRLQRRRDAAVSALISGVLVFGTTLAVYFAMTFTYVKVLPFEVPLLQLAAGMGKWAEYLYCAVMLLAMLTSAVAAGYGFVEKLATDWRLRPRVVLLGMCLLSIPFATLGFANLVSALYGFFGVVGLAVLLATTYRCMRELS